MNRHKNNLYACMFVHTLLRVQGSEAFMYAKRDLCICQKRPTVQILLRIQVSEAFNASGHDIRYLSLMCPQCDTNIRGIRHGIP